MAVTKEKLEIWYADVTHMYTHNILKSSYVVIYYKRGDDERLTN